MGNVWARRVCAASVRVTGGLRVQRNVLGAMPEWASARGTDGVTLCQVSVIVCLSIICFAIFILSLKDIVFESLKSFLLIFFFKITTHDITGPAKHPLPTSSIPASILLPIKSNFKFRYFFSYHF